jgi:HlyD family secretion protein
MKPMHVEALDPAPAGSPQRAAAEGSAGEPAREIEALLDLPGWDALRRPSARKRWLAAGALAAAAGALALVRLLEPADTVQYHTEPVVRGALRVVVTAIGSLQPTHQVDVSSEISGTVRNVLVELDDPVRAGDLLAELDTDRLHASVESSRARLQAARARVAEGEVTLREAEREHGRQRALASGRISSDRDLDAARAAQERAAASLVSLRAEVGAAQAELHLNQANLAKASIASPIDGVVLVRSVNPGQTVAASLQAPVLFSIAEDLAKMEAKVAVDEADVGQVKEGQSAALSVDAYPDRSFAAQIRELHFASETVQGVVTYQAVLAVDNPELLLRPGMTATASITVEERKDALLVPNAALRFAPPQTAQAGRAGLRGLLPAPPAFRPASPNPEEAKGRRRQVWALREGRPVAVEVQVGASDGRSTQIVAGALAQGDAVIVDATAEAGS